jgi:DNA repair protein RadC
MKRSPKRADILSHLQYIRALKQEYFVCLSIDSGQHVIACRTVFIGTLTSVVAHPREIFACAVADHAATVIVAHNHPSGIAEPSDEDITTTQQLAAAGQILGIPLTDHIIVTSDGHFSFFAHGMI